MAHPGRVASHAVGVEHGHVRVPALGEPAALAQPVEPGGLVGDEMHGVLEADHTALAHRFTQQGGEVGERVAHVEMSAGVRASIGRAKVSAQPGTASSTIPLAKLRRIFMRSGTVRAITRAPRAVAWSPAASWPR